jgi:cold shock protein
MNSIRTNLRYSLMDRERGVVKWYNETKNYGFITPDHGGGDLFFHRTDLETVEQTIEQGERVEYEIGSGAKGPQAKAIRPLPLEQ